MKQRTKQEYLSSLKPQKQSDTIDLEEALMKLS